MSKYDPLREHLLSLPSDVWRASFSDVEAVLGFILPDSARKFAAWWANQHPPLSQTSGWSGAGWRTTDLDLENQTVTFQRMSVSTPEQRDHNVRLPLTSTKQHPHALPHAWDSPNLVDVRTRFEWKPIGRVVLDQKRRLVFPKVQNLPGLYRFRVLRNGREARYFGETDNISRRFSHYRNPAADQETNLRINARFVQALSGGAEISVAIVTDGTQIDSGGGFRPIGVNSKFARRLLESAALIESNGIDVEKLNRGD